MSGIAGTHGTLRKGCKLSLLSSVSLMESSSFLLSFLPVSRDACKFVLFSHRREPLWIERRSGLQLPAHAFSLLPPVVYLTGTAHICIYTLWEASSGFLRTVFPSQTVFSGVAFYVPYASSSSISSSSHIIHLQLLFLFIIFKKI